MQSKFKSDQLFFLTGLVLLTINVSFILMVNSKLFTFIKVITAILFMIAALLKRWPINAIIEVFVIFGMMLISYFQTKNVDILYLYLAIVASKNIDFRLSVKFATITRVIGFIGTILLSYFGFISSFVSYREEEVRYSLGYLHPNMASSNFFFIILGIIFLRYKKIGIIDYFFIILSLLIISDLTGNRTDLFLGILLIVLLVFRRHLSNVLLIRNWWLLAFFVSVSMSYIYNIHPIGILQTINDLLTGRLYQASDFINLYNPNLFGNKLNLMSTVSSEYVNAIGSKGRVYILDNMYVNLLLQHGVLITAWVLINVRRLLTLEITKVNEHVEANIICIYFIIFALYAVTENTPISIDYNVFLIIFANNINNWTKKEGKIDV